jgi:hypothetical protein
MSYLLGFLEFVNFVDFFYNFSVQQEASYPKQKLNSLKVANFRALPMMQILVFKV